MQCHMTLCYIFDMAEMESKNKQLLGIKEYVNGYYQNLMKLFYEFLKGKFWELFLDLQMTTENGE